MKGLKFFKRKSPVEAALYLFVSIIFMLVALSYLYIIVWTFIAGFRTHHEIVVDPFGLPKIWNWRNYIDVFKELEVNGIGFGQMLFNSVYFSVVNPLLCEFTTIAFAYCCTKYKFPGSKWPYVIILFMITLPLYGTGGASYRIYHALGLVNSYWQVIASLSGFNVKFLYYHSFFKNLSWTYAEAAIMDGANDFQIYLKVMFPQAKPIFWAMFLTSWLSGWNDYQSALIYLRKLPTLAVGIYEFYTQMLYHARFDILFAACFIIFVPALILFAAFNKTLTTSVSVGGLKG